jgi:hypothetical protein
LTTVEVTGALRISSGMDEFQLQAWERELAAWRRKVGGVPLSPAMENELDAVAVEIAHTRARVREGARVSGDSVLRHFSRLRDLWNYCQAGESRTTPA